MVFVQLGFTELIQEILATIFNKIFAPYLKKALLAIFHLIWSLFQNFLGEFLLTSFTMWLSFVDYVSSLYDILTGVETVAYGEEEGLTLLQALFRIDTIGRAFIILTAAAIILAFGFSIVSVARSMADSAMENKQPISVVLRWALKSALSFAMVPLLCLFMLHFTKSIFTVFSQIEYTDSREGSHGVAIVGTTPGDILFVTMVQDAIVVPDEFDKDATRADYIQQRLDYYLTELGDVAAEQFSYRNIDQVLEDVDASKVNYVLAFASVCCLLILMLMSAIMLVRRMIELLVLYLVSPFFAATIALDGGGVFKKWKDMFIGKFFAGAGTMISMKLFLIVLPLLASDRIHYSADKMMNQIITILFVLGGAWAVYNASITLGRVLDPDSAQEEESQRRDTLNFIKGRWSKMRQNSQQGQMNQMQQQMQQMQQGGQGGNNGQGQG